MLVLAMMIIIFPLFKTPSSIAHIDRHQVNLNLYQEYISELKDELHKGLRDQQSYDIAKLEAEKNLLQDITAPEITPHIAKKTPYFLILLLSVAFAGVSITAYWHWGHSQQLASYLTLQERMQQQQQLQQQFGSVTLLIQQLKTKLKHDGDARGWYLLGRLYFSQQNFIAAADAFEHANLLQPNQSDYMMQYIQASYLAHHEILTSKAKKLLQQVLATQPDNELGLNILAVDAYKHGDYQTALTIWQRLLPRYPSNSADSQAILAGIQNAQQKINK